jgi:hypothetical protein
MGVGDTREGDPTERDGRIKLGSDRWAQKTVTGRCSARAVLYRDCRLPRRRLCRPRGLTVKLYGVQVKWVCDHSLVGGVKGHRTRLSGPHVSRQIEV